MNLSNKKIRRLCWLKCTPSRARLNQAPSSSVSLRTMASNNNLVNGLSFSATSVDLRRASAWDSIQLFAPRKPHISALKLTKVIRARSPRLRSTSAKRTEQRGARLGQDLFVLTSKKLVQPSRARKRENGGRCLGCTLLRLNFCDFRLWSCSLGVMAQAQRKWACLILWWPPP